MASSGIPDLDLSQPMRMYAIKCSLVAHAAHILRGPRLGSSAITHFLVFFSRNINASTYVSHCAPPDGVRARLPSTPGSRVTTAPYFVPNIRSPASPRPGMI